MNSQSQAVSVVKLSAWPATIRLPNGTVLTQRPALPKVNFGAQWPR